MSARQTVDASSFAGTWRLQDAFAETPAGRQAFPLGEGTTGLIMYDTAGHMSAQLMSAGRQRLTSPNLDEVPLEEFKAAYLGYTSYYGTYTLNTIENTVTHHVEGSLAVGWVGGDQVRYYEFDDGGLLTLKTPPIRIKDGSKVINTLVWRRA